MSPPAEPADTSAPLNFEDPLYDPNTGRFLQTDPVTGGSCNSYDYVCGDPVNMVDLDGRMAAIALVSRWVA